MGGDLLYQGDGQLFTIRKGSHWRHKARGTEYQLIGTALVQTGGEPMKDGDKPLLYRDIHDPEKYAVRFPEEFADGRFEFLDSDTPVTHDFLLGLSIEAEHQKERWGEAHDRSKSAENWFWLIGYLAGKALRAHMTGDKPTALHHTISAAAALMQWHAAILGDDSGAGIGQDADLKSEE